MNEIQPPQDCLVAFGSNLGDSLQTYEQTRQMMDERFNTPIRASHPLKTEPIGGPAGQPQYLNGVFRFSTHLSPFEIHHQLREIETLMGRERHQRWGARTLDLDLLLLGPEIINTRKLTVPHPRMAVRKFVLQPALEIAAEMRHPVCNRTLSEILNHLDHADREIVWVTDDSPFSNECRNAVIKAIFTECPTWKFELASDPLRLSILKPSARFVIWANPRPWGMQEETFEGPQFEINLIDNSVPNEDKVDMQGNAVGLAEEPPSGTSPRRRSVSEIVAEIFAAIQSSS